MKASFLIKAKQPNTITEKGVRVFVMERLLNSSFDKGSVVNLDDKTVQVRLEGDEKEIRKFKELLEKEIIAKFGNPTIVFTQIQETTDNVPVLLKSSQALMVGQLQKGIGIQLEILGTLKNMPRNHNDILLALKELPQEIARALKESKSG
ncbi:MAG TPA: hypothetical protein VJH23_00220 [archaeon]|nr:hypothetical protein [archaeon]